MQISSKNLARVLNGTQRSYLMHQTYSTPYRKKILADFVKISNFWANFDLQMATKHKIGIFEKKVESYPPW